jgi:hypothetical protein
MNWPKKGDKAFIGEIDPHSPVHAYIDWLKYNFDHISRSFKEAGDKIVNDLESGKNLLHPDIFFFPICYLYRHTIELELKGIVEVGVKLGILPDDEKYKELQGSHSLHPLWNRAEEALKDFYAGEPPEDLRAARSLVLQFHELDKTGQSFRYYKTRTGKSTLNNAPKIVDLANLRDKFDGLYNFLTATGGGMEEALSSMLDNY